MRREGTYRIQLTRDDSDHHRSDVVRLSKAPQVDSPNGVERVLRDLHAFAFSKLSRSIGNSGEYRTRAREFEFRTNLNSRQFNEL